MLILKSFSSLFIFLFDRHIYIVHVVSLICIIYIDSRFEQKNYIKTYTSVLKEILLFICPVQLNFFLPNDGIYFNEKYNLNL